MYSVAAKGPFTIYGIVDPKTGQFGYVGQTSDFAKKKRFHLESVQKRVVGEQGAPTSIRSWLQHTLSHGGAPSFVILETVDSWHRSTRCEAEWVQRLSAKEHPLLNRWHRGEDSSECQHDNEHDQPGHFTPPSVGPVEMKRFESVSRSQGEAAPATGRKMPPANAGKPWTESLDNELVLQFGSGVSIGEIARGMQRTRGAIQSRLVRLGLLDVPLTAQATVAAGGDKPTGVSRVVPETRTSIPGNRGWVWTRAMDLEASAMFRNGAGATEMASKLQRTTAGVRARLVRLGLIRKRSDLRH